MITQEIDLKKTYTIEEYLNLPTNGTRYELVKGKLVKMSPTGRKHGKIATTLAIELGGYIRQNNLGETYVTDTGFTLDPVAGTVREADLGFVSSSRLVDVPEDGILPIVPDLVVEIISPSDILIEVEDKVDDWLEAGVRLVWVINPRSRGKGVYVYRPGSKDRQFLDLDDELDGENIVHGFKLKVRELFD